MNYQTDLFRIGNWPRSQVNPYLDLYYEAVRKHGIQRTLEVEINDHFLRSNQHLFDAIHIHWTIESVWLSKSRFDSLRKIVGLYRYLRLAKSKNKKIIWTIHELLSNEQSTWINRLGYLVMSKMSDLLIFHDTRTQHIFSLCYGVSDRNSIVMRHGNFERAYPTPRDEPIVRESFRLKSGRPTVLCLGFITHHKGFDLAIEAIKQFKGKFQLIIAGIPTSGVEENLKCLASGTDQVILSFNRLSNQDVSDLHSVSQAVMLPYRRVTASGSLLTAFSLQRGVIASPLPYFRSVCSLEPESSVIAKEVSSLAFADAIAEYFSIESTVRNKAAARVSKAHCWEDCIIPVAEWINRNWGRSRIG